jgi:predicted DCC family thiol-disulfide oxidoreductase YuxK
MATKLNVTRCKQAGSMTTAIKTADRIVAYDGDCPMCTSTIRLLIGLKLLKPAQTRGIHDLDRADFDAVYAAGIRNQLVVIDPITREARSGTDGLLWILRENTANHFLVRLLALPGPRHLLRWGYQIVSYNRRIISPPRQRIVCDCEPEVTLARRLSLILPLLVLTILIAAGFGAAVFRGWELGNARSGAIFMLIVVGWSWLALDLASLRLLGEKRIDYLGHLTVTMFVGALVLVPASLVTPLVPRPGLIALDCLSVLASFSLMFAMQRRRISALAIPSGWLWAWVVALAMAFDIAAILMFLPSIS